MLIFACTTLTAATVLLYIMVPIMYLDMKILLNPSLELGSFQKPGAVEQAIWFQQMIYAFLSLTWTTIFGVKMCFLLFFWQMVNRLRSFMIYWRVVVAFTAVSYFICVFGSLIGCPKTGQESRKS